MSYLHVIVKKFEENFVTPSLLLEGLHVIRTLTFRTETIVLY
jgi:hypothetical protein